MSATSAPKIAVAGVAAGAALLSPSETFSLEGHLRQTQTQNPARVYPLLLRLALRQLLVPRPSLFPHPRARMEIALGTSRSTTALLSVHGVISTIRTNQRAEAVEAESSKLR